LVYEEVGAEWAAPLVWWEEVGARWEAPLEHWE
jgi:hypothetical protein